mmetsp:Transcript_47838/g.102494  ORF Transcript_47838/g.102494 Transcript_47838/m.102494 type:complete len:202 (+) Transcript_47838:143-748(+)
MCAVLTSTSSTLISLFAVVLASADHQSPSAVAPPLRPPMTQWPSLPKSMHSSMRCILLVFSFVCPSTLGWPLLTPGIFFLDTIIGGIDLLFLPWTHSSRKVLFYSTSVWPSLPFVCVCCLCLLNIPRPCITRCGMRLSAGSLHSITCLTLSDLYDPLTALRRSCSVSLIASPSEVLIAAWDQRSRLGTNATVFFPRRLDNM